MENKQTNKDKNRGLIMDIQFVDRKVVLDSILDKMTRKEKLTEDERDFLFQMSDNIEDEYWYYSLIWTWESLNLKEISNDKWRDK